MSWISRYRLRHLLRSMWVVPVVCMVAGSVLGRWCWEFDVAHRWEVLRYSLEGAKSVLGAVRDATLTLTVFMASVILIAVQMVSVQLTPRVITAIYSHTALRYAAGLFLFAYTFSVTVLGRMEGVVPQASVFASALLGMVSVAVFVLMIDTVGKILRPVVVAAFLFRLGADVIEVVYPRPFDPAALHPDLAVPASQQGECRVVRLPKPAGVLLSVDVAGLVALAQKSGGMITILPQVGDFVAAGEPMFRLHGEATTLQDRDLIQSVAVGPERTMEQDPGFAFRILVDIAIRALSPAVNDPTTAVVAIDQLHRLLRLVGHRDLETGSMRDQDGRLRLSARTPGWDDFVALALTEIRHCGAGSIQVVRRLRALLDNLLEDLPPERAPALQVQARLLDLATARHLKDPEDLAQACRGDAQGLGSRCEVAAAGSQRGSLDGRRE